MVRSGCCTALSKALLVFLLVSSTAASALSWQNWAGARRTEGRVQIPPNTSGSQLQGRHPYIPSSYDVVLDELAQLESEPLCHRIAARLLVNNCQLLEGKDEATVLTDSGRKIRDFVDSYAASLAICDLERGRFQIPDECIKFREPTLSQLSLQEAVHLHVTSTEIDACLSGLGASDSAWNTWVSYRHKALRFCEAARADNDKDEHIALFKRLTKIMSSLTHDVDERLEERMNNIDVRTKAVADELDNLSLLLAKLHQGMDTADAMISDHLVRSIRDSQGHLDSGLQSAVHLERMLELLIRGVTDSHAEMANAQEQSLHLVTQKAKSEVVGVVNTMAAAVAASVALQNQVELFHRQAVDLEEKQVALDKGMQRLGHISDQLVIQYDAHSNLLQQANIMTGEILDKLGDTAASATTLNNELRRRAPSESWWPYIWCPVASLIMGSYGLPPSLPRNMGLLLFGETAGFFISSFNSVSFDSIWWTTPFSTSNLATTDDDSSNVTRMKPASESELR
ncbi:hypothetical protein F5Y17DRAFT_428716 [Xylariaceae sp. FL0594]|nr:hypothetical protein F5Y17DRAFT_428716 [Xylariaceae sp. FL0594]